MGITGRCSVQALFFCLCQIELISPIWYGSMKGKTFHGSHVIIEPIFYMMNCCTYIDQTICEKILWCYVLSIDTRNAVEKDYKSLSKGAINPNTFKI